MTEPRSNRPLSLNSLCSSLFSWAAPKVDESNTCIDEIETRLVDFRSERLCTGFEDEVRFNKAYGRIWRRGCLERGCMLIICLKSPGLRPYKANGKPKQSWLWGNFTGNDTENGLLMLSGQVGPMTHNSAGWVEKSRVSARTVRKGSLMASL